jgi:hypothetical protein
MYVYYCYCTGIYIGIHSYSCGLIACQDSIQNFTSFAVVSLIRNLPAFTTMETGVRPSTNLCLFLTSKIKIVVIILFIEED